MYLSIRILKVVSDFLRDPPPDVDMNMSNGNLWTIWAIWTIIRQCTSLYYQQVPDRPVDSASNKLPTKRQPLPHSAGHVLVRVSRDGFA